MIPHNFQHLVGGKCVQGITAEAGRSMLWKDSIDFGFISHEFEPVFFFQPRHFPGNSKSLEAGLQAATFLFCPLSEHTIGVEVAAAQVPVAAIQNLDLT